MAITGKLVREVGIQCGGNYVHQIFRYKPNETAVMAPDKIQRCDLVSGQWGTPGSVISWHFIHDGKVNTAKEIIEAVHEESHKVVFKVIEGEVLQVYNALSLTFHIKDMGDKQLVIWTMDFQKVNASIPDPTAYIDLICALTKDVDSYIHKQA